MTKASSGPSIPRRVSRLRRRSRPARRRRPSSSSAAPTTPSGRGELIATRLGLAASSRAGAAEAPLRNARRRAFARAAFALAVCLLSGWQSAEPDPPHAPTVGARDGERNRHGDDGLQRRRDFLRLRQRPPERTLRLSLRQRDRRAAGADRLPARPRQAAKPTRRASRLFSTTTRLTMRCMSRASRRSQ